MFVLHNRIFCSDQVFSHQADEKYTYMWAYLCLLKERKMLVYEVPNKTDINTVLREQLFMNCFICNKVQIITTHLKYVTTLIVFTVTTGFCILWLMCRYALVIYEYHHYSYPCYHMSSYCYNLYLVP